MGLLFCCTVLGDSVVLLIFGQYICPLLLTHGCLSLILLRFLSMVHHFAINTVFTVSGEVVSGLIGVLVVTLPIVAVASVFLSA